MRTVNDRPRNRKQVRLERVEPETPQRKRQILLWRVHGDLEGETQNVKWPTR
jgi:hypothetical protein